MKEGKVRRVTGNKVRRGKMEDRRWNYLLCLMFYFLSPPLPHSISLLCSYTTCPLLFHWSFSLCSVLLHVHTYWQTESGSGRDSREGFQWATNICTARAWFPEISNADRLPTQRGYFLLLFWQANIYFLADQYTVRAWFQR